MFFEKNLFPLTFTQWIWKNNENKIYLILFIFLLITQYIFFIRIYPYPNFLPDSYSYIEAAFQNVSINMWPVGYSKFLRFVSVFDHSGAGLFAVQYFLLSGSILFFLLTIKFLLNVGIWVIRLLYIVLIINPLWLYLSNFVSSDALFASTSLLWLTSLLWIMNEPGNSLVLFHGLILFFVFSVRYNAMYYPIITVLVILTTKTVIKQKIIWLFLSCLPVFIFLIHTISTYQDKTNTTQFSPFGGWQLAANAMYMYAHISPKSKMLIPNELMNLHNLTVEHMDSLNHIPENKRPDNELGIYYLWNEKAPLKLFLAYKYSKDSTTNYLKRWAKVAPLYGRYGAWLIKQYPLEFARYYLWPNLVNYYVPSPEFLGVYNMGSDSIEIGAMQWFGYKSRKVSGYSKDKMITVTKIFSPTLAIINVLFFTGFLGFVYLRGVKKVSLFYKNALFLFLIIWFSNLSFSVVASPIVLRYQVFPFIFTLTFAIILLSYVIQECFTIPQNGQPKFSNLEGHIATIVK